METGEAALECASSTPRLSTSWFWTSCCPGKDGFTVMSEMREAGQFVPTLMLTARGHPEDVLQGFAAGADDYLTKPFELAILIARLRGLLRRKEWLHPWPTAAARLLNQRHVPFGDKSVDFDRVRAARARSGVSADADGSQCSALSDPARRASTFAQGACSRTYGACTRTPIRARSTTSSCACGVISRMIRRAPRHLLTVRGVGYRFVQNPGE